MTTGWLNIGKVGKAHGLRGAFFVRGREELVPKSYESVRIGADPQRASSTKITHTRWQSGAAVLAVDAITSREMVEAVVGQSIWVERDRVNVDESAEFLWEDLLGRAVVDSLGIDLGKLKDIYNTGAADIAVVVHPTRGSLEIAMVEDYFDFDLAPTGPIKLAVEAAMFDDLWQEKS